MKPKILTLDIETKPAIGYLWGLFDQNVAVNQIIEPGGTICVAAKYVGQEEVFFYSEWEHGKKAMLQGIHKLLSEADGVITYNGDRFDLPKLNGEFISVGLLPPPPPTSIDLYKTVKKFGFLSGKLEFVGPYLGVGRKVKNEGFGLWAKVMNGDERAQARMKKYCIRDVIVTERLYKRIKPYIRNHPHMGMVGNVACGACGSTDTQKRGFRRTKAYIIQRLQCNKCGSWSDGARKKVP